MKLQIWDAVFPSPTHNCKKLKHGLIECLNHATFQALRKLFLCYAFHSSLQQYCGEDVTESTSFRKYYHCSTQPRQWSCCVRNWWANRSVCVMEILQCLMTGTPSLVAKANGVVRQWETVLTFGGALPSLHPSHNLQPHQPEDSQMTMENMCSRTTVQQGPCSPQYNPPFHRKNQNYFWCFTSRHIEWIVVPACQCI